MNELSIAERVANGVRWLDANKPDWWKRLDLAVLDIEAPCNCVIGQLFGDYHKSPFGEASRLAQQVAASHGFNSQPTSNRFDYDRSDDDIDEELAALEAEWARVVTARRESAQAEERTEEKDRVDERSS